MRMGLPYEAFCLRKVPLVERPQLDFTLPLITVFSISCRSSMRTYLVSESMRRKLGSFWIYRLTRNARVLDPVCSLAIDFRQGSKAMK